jgi:hypothetical protein
MAARELPPGDGVDVVEPERVAEEVKGEKKGEEERGEDYNAQPTQKAQLKNYLVR